jgi:hypothetical protein
MILISYFNGRIDLAASQSERKIAAGTDEDSHREYQYLLRQKRDT